VLAQRAQQALERNDIAGAESLYRRILERRNDDAVALEYLGVIASKAHRHDDAERLLTRALELNPEAPEFHNNLGLLRHAQADMEQAAACYRRALQLAPDNAAAHNNLGLALYESGRLEAAIASFREAVRLSPEFAEAHWNLALALLRNGEYPEGFLEHEWRMRFPQHQASWARKKKYPEWRGEPLAGKRILVLTEQGLGDLIQFVRYAEQLVAQGATVVVEAAPELIELMRTVPGVADVVPRFGPYPQCDFCVAVMSLPLRFATLPGTIPSLDRYLRADPARIARWQQLLGTRARPRIGIAWAGNPEQARDRYRSMALAHFAPLLAQREYEWLSLQKGPAAEQIAALPAEVRPRDLGKHSETFADLAALIESLDLVITVCTSVVHVAGALGKPAVLLLDTEHDWRWPRNGCETRWYPSVRIVRQPARGDWAGAIREALLEVRRLVPVKADAAATTPGV
jgi:ADP-heptose:LPS heptosyltransferase